MQAMPGALIKTATANHTIIGMTARSARSAAIEDGPNEAFMSVCAEGFGVQPSQVMGVSAKSTITL